MKPKWGTNLQNIEKSVREIYEADDGKKFVQVDQDGAEARIVAFCCKDGDYRKLFTNRVKPHVYVAMHMFKDVWPRKMLDARLISSIHDVDMDDFCSLPIRAIKHYPLWNELDTIVKESDNWSLSERYYYLSKQVCHSSNYGITPPTLRLNILEKSGGKIVISKEEAERFLLTYHALFPEIREMHKWVEKQVNELKVLYNLFGHPFQITQYEILESTWKELYAWIFQSTVGEITNTAYARMHNYIRSNRRQWDLLANTHDSYLIQCPEAEEMDCARRAKEYIEQTFKSPIDGTEFQMKSEAQSGWNWAPYKAGKNERGLRAIKGL